MGITQSQFDELCRRAGTPTDAEKLRVKASKLKNVKKQVGDITFDSALEAMAFQVLSLWLKAGAISDLRLQPGFTLQEKFRDATTGKTTNSIRYSADFRFFDETARKTRYVDAKGMVTQAFFRTMKMMKNKFPDVEIELWDREKIKELSRQ